MNKYLKLKINYNLYIIENYNIDTKYAGFYLISGFDNNGMYYQILIRKRNIISEEETEDYLIIKAIR